MATKSLSLDRNERLRGLVRSLLADAGDNQSELARRMGLRGITIKGSQFSEFLSEKKGAGLALLDALHSYTGKSYDELITGKGPAAQIAPAAGPPDIPQERARAAAVALGYPESAIAAGIQEATKDNDLEDAWEILARIRTKSRGTTSALPDTKVKRSPLASDASKVKDFSEQVERAETAAEATEKPRGKT